MLGIKGMSVLPLFLVQWSVLDHIFTLLVTECSCLLLVVSEILAYLH